MSNIIELPTEKRFDEASEWLARMDAEMTPEQERAFERWLAASPENQRVLLKMAKLWDNMDSLDRLADLFPQPTAQNKIIPRFVPAMAASILAVVLFGAWSFTNLPGLDLFDPVAAVSQPVNLDTVYETSVGAQSTASLPDGTEISLNTDSLINVTYSDHYRLIVLERGEIHVQVAHDPSRPLSVLAGDRVIRAVGTAFNVQLNRNEQVELIVTEGKVRVGESTGEVLERIEAIELAAGSVAVAKGNRVVLGSAEEAIEKIAAEDIEIDLSWRKGNLVFKGESLEKAIEEIGRYTPVEFEITDDRIKEIRVAGLFRAGDVNGLLRTLRKNFNVSSEFIGQEKVQLSMK